jgi:CrcB protein
VTTVVGFVVAAASGSLLRAEAGRRFNQPGGWPGGTLLVNVVGSFLLGLLSGVHPPTSTVLGVAGLGAFTTFSSFSRDVVALVEERRYGLVVTYLAATLVVSVAAAGIGVALS